MSARPFTEAEYTIIIEHLARQGGFRDRLLIMLGCSTGFRIRELLSLRVADVWTGTDVVHEVRIERRNLKGGKGCRPHRVRGRRVPLSETVRATIRTHLEIIGVSDPQRALFATSRSGGAPMNLSQAFRVIVGAAAQCGIDASRISTHSSRKTFARRIYEGSGRCLVTTQRILGHSSPAITARYLETDAAALDNLVRSLAA